MTVMWGESVDYAGSAHFFMFCSFRPSWSPDGKWIAFTSDRDTKRARWDGGWELVQSTALCIVRADGSSLRRLRVATMESGREANRVLPVDAARCLSGTVRPQPSFGLANRVGGCRVGCAPRVYFRPRLESDAAVPPRQPDRLPPKLPPPPTARPPRRHHSPA